MNTTGMIAGLFVLFTCVLMIFTAIIKERNIIKSHSKKAFLRVRHFLVCLGIFWNIILGVTVLQLSSRPISPSLPHDIYLLPLFVTPLGYMLFFVYYAKAKAELLKM